MRTFCLTLKQTNNENLNIIIWPVVRWLNSGRVLESVSVSYSILLLADGDKWIGTHKRKCLIFKKIEKWKH